ncbi:hypothetical protein P1P75_05905 [Streptomyces sp. ID05-39B]|uniref:hypothetical protein n=1 Tax=Streptomyces sp. ID05-39B TaxID=3028664 RepID=UPI0029AA54E6|nr:hypothetical protein [Streptomyces sp. ID05-39B]MDX3525980.1 hypothetical protein [Streptomyces sp. ID05-39B]
MNSLTPATSSTPGSAQPVDVRLMGEDRAVRALVTALQQSAACGPATYKPMRDGNVTRAYLSVVVPLGPTPSP